MSSPGAVLRKRSLLLLLIFLLGMALLAGRLVYIQFVRGPHLRDLALEQRTWSVPVEPRRGTIYDRNMRPLVVSENLDSVFVNPAEIRDKEAVAAKLAEVLGLEEEAVLKRISRRTAFEWVQRKVTKERGAAIRELDLRGVYLTQESKRVYPLGSLAAHVLGFAGIDSQGLNGIELFYDEKLRGKPGQLRVEYDARSQEIPQGVQSFVEPTEGLGLQLTLDESIQYFAERELARGVLQAGAKAGRVIVMDPRNGEILAMANWPTFDLNEWQDVDSDLWRNSSISDSFSPGSVFKPVVAAAAIEDGKVTPSTPLYDSGSLKVPGHTITNWNGAGLGAVTFATAFEKSANTIFASTALSLGTDRFYHFLDGFGFIDKTGIDLPGEAVGIRPRKEAVKPLDLAVMGFGQTLTVTPIQMAASVAAIANGGILPQPHFAKAFYDQEGNLVEDVSPSPKRRVISESTAEAVKQLMQQVVDEGTGTLARVPGYRLGGKTGTSEKVVDGRLAPGKYIASYIGFGPVEDPRLLVYVMIDEPQGVYYGGTVAAPVAAAVMKDSLHYLGIPPTASLEETAPAQVDPYTGQTLTVAQHNKTEKMMETPDLIGLSPAEARQKLSGMGATLQIVGGSGVSIIKQSPQAGQRIQVGDVVTVETDVVEAPEGKVIVPDLGGLSLRRVQSELEKEGLLLDPTGSGVAVQQWPQAGTIMDRQSEVRVRFEPPNLTLPHAQEGSGR